MLTRQIRTLRRLARRAMKRREAQARLRAVTILTDAEPQVAITAQPCGYCGATDGYDTGYDGWERCRSCQGC